MNRRISRWLYRKAAQALGEEELESLKSDLITPVKKICWKTKMRKKRNK